MTFHNIAAGNRCALLCNGHSLWEFPAGYPWDIIGVNRSWMITRESRFHFALTIEQLDALYEQPFQLERLIVGYHRGQTESERRRRCTAKSVLMIKGWTQNDCVTRGIGFARDLGKEVPWMPNTPYLALQFIRWFGYKHIDIWGLDLGGPKFWDKTWIMTEGHAKQQDEFFQYAAGVLANDGVRVVNRNTKSLCTAFEKERWV